MVLAAPTPVRIVAHDDELVESVDPAAIGASGNDFRKVFSRFGKTVVQHPDQGLLYRDAGSPAAGSRSQAFRPPTCCNLPRPPMCRRRRNMRCSSRSRPT